MGPVQFAVFMGNRNDNMQDHSELRNGLERETRRRAADSLCVTPCAGHCAKSVICMISVNHETVSPVEISPFITPVSKIP